MLDQLVGLYRRPTTIKGDKGSEFVVKKVLEWIENRHINVRYIDPGSPWKNGQNESLNDGFRARCLNRWLFDSVRAVSEATEAWPYEYNLERLHGSLSGCPPGIFFEQWEEAGRKEA